MSKRDLLLEIGMEELPARFVAPAAAQLKEKLEKWLQTERVEFEQINLYESPRRLAVLVTGVSEQQADRNDEAKGPAKKSLKTRLATGRKPRSALPAAMV